MDHGINPPNYPEKVKLGNSMHVLAMQVFSIMYYYRQLICKILKNIKVLVLKILKLP